MTKIYLPPSFLMEAAPLFDDAAASYGSTDPYLQSFAPIVDKIRAARPDKHGYITIEVTPGEAAALAKEGRYREGECRERAADAYDNRERMAMLGSATGCAGVARRAQKIVEESSRLG